MRQHQAVLAWAGCAKEIMQFVEKISDGLVCELLYLCALDGMPIAELERIYSLPAKDRKEKAAEIWKERQRFLQRIYGKNAEIEQQHIVKLHQDINQMFKNSEKKQREMENCMTEIRNLCKAWQERQDESGTSVLEDNKTLLEETEEPPQPAKVAVRKQAVERACDEGGEKRKDISRGEQRDCSSNKFSWLI